MPLSCDSLSSPVGLFDLGFGGLTSFPDLRGVVFFFFSVYSSNWLRQSCDFYILVQKLFITLVGKKTCSICMSYELMAPS